MKDNLLVDHDSISVYRSKSNDLVILCEVLSALSILERLLGEIAVGFASVGANMKKVEGVVPSEIG
jgi:hypothetical protein